VPGAEAGTVTGHAGLAALLADAEDAIGQVIGHAESWGMSAVPLDPAEVRRVLLEVCAQWTGGLRVPDAGGSGA
jgi:hypothetical protein